LFFIEPDGELGPRSADMSGVRMSYFGSLAVTNTASI